MGYPPRGLGDHGEQSPGATPSVLLDSRPPDAWRRAEGEQTAVNPGSISCDALAIDLQPTGVEGSGVSANPVRHDLAEWQWHPAAAHIPRLRRYARALVRDPDAADDLVQETLEHAANKLHLWQRGSDMRAWLFSVLHNVFVNQSRKYRPVVALEPQQLPAILVKPTQGARIEIAEIKKALHRIPEKQREVLLLVALEQMTYEEVAKTLSIPIDMVMARLSRARERMRGLMIGSNPGTSLT